MFDKFIIFGAGYVGATLGVLLSRKYRVDLIDIDKKKVNLINNKKSPIKDGRIQSLLNSKKSNISASINFEKLVTSNQLIILALPTDYDEKNNNFDVSLILNTLKNRKSNQMQ